MKNFSISINIDLMYLELYIYINVNQNSILNFGVYPKNEKVKKKKQLKKKGVHETLNQKGYR